MEPKRFSEVLEVVLTEEEIKQKSEENNKRVLERASVKAKAKKIGDGFTLKIKGLDHEIETTAEILEAGKETRSVECEWMPNWETKEMVARRLDTWAELRRRPMDLEERQERFWETAAFATSPSTVETEVKEETEQVVVCANCGCPQNRHYSMGCEDCQCEDFVPKQNEDDLAPPDVLQTILALVVEQEIPTATIETWTRGQRRQAEEWAVATHAAASDNDLVVVPERPEFLVFDEEIAAEAPVEGEGQADEFTAPRCDECKMTDGGHTPTCSQSNRLTYEDYLAYATAHYKGNYNTHARKMELRRDPEIDARVRDWIKETAPKALEATG